MNRPIATDTVPWHRQFWPWFLIALPATVVVAAFATLYIANRHSDDLVVDEYYKEGLAINQRLEKQQRASDLGIVAQFSLGGAQAQVNLTGPVNDRILLLRLSHPLEADEDISVALERTAPGTWSGELPANVAPRWHWTLESAEQAWSLAGSLSKDDFGDGRGG